MIKRRPVVVLTAHRRNAKLVTVVPLSSTRPVPVEEHHCKLRPNPLPHPRADEIWAKCDMVAVVSIERLDAVITGCRLPDGRRERRIPRISREQFDEIRRGVASALGLAPMLDPPAHR